MLLNEALESLAIVRDGWYVDSTYGRGGHTSRILAALGERGRLLALDKDPAAVAHARANFGSDPRFSVRFGGFENFCTLVAPWLREQPLAGALFDLGISSAQLDDAARGFSFSRDGPLDMRMNTDEGISAQQWLQQVDEAEWPASCDFRGGASGAKDRAGHSSGSRVGPPRHYRPICGDRGTGAGPRHVGSTLRHASSRQSACPYHGTQSPGVPPSGNASVARRGGRLWTSFLFS